MSGADDTRTEYKELMSTMTQKVCGCEKTRILGRALVSSFANVHRQQGKPPALNRPCNVYYKTT